VREGKSTRTPANQEGGGSRRKTGEVDAGAGTESTTSRGKREVEGGARMEWPGGDESRRMERGGGGGVFNASEILGSVKRLERNPVRKKRKQNQKRGGNSTRSNCGGRKKLLKTNPGE